MLTLDAIYGTTTHRTASRYAPPVVTTQPTEEPVTVEEARSQCAFDGPALDVEFQNQIVAAREAVELDLDTALVTQTCKQFLDYFPSGPIEWRKPPLQSATITYVDSNGTTQTWSSTEYQLDIYSRPGIIIPAYGYSYPSARAQLRSIAVTAVCGYGAANLVPKLLKQAILLRVASMFRNREMSKEETMSYENIIHKFMWRKFI